MYLIDTHAHLYTADFHHDLPLTLARAQKNRVDKMYMPNIDETTIPKMMAVAERYPAQCLPMMGIHPCYITANFTRQLYLVEEWLDKSAFIGIGEIGIDLYHDSSLLEEQEEAFMIQLTLAKKHQLPVAIHCRNAFKEVIQLLSKAQDGSLRGVIHCFSGTPTEAEQCIGLGFSLGIGGMLTMPKSSLSSNIAAINLAHLVLETDSPYLAPAPYRHKRNEPSYLHYIAERLAELKQLSWTEIALITTENAKKIFEPNC